MYDIFFVGRGQINDELWKTFKTRFPNAQRVDNCTSFNQLAAKSLTKMFWAVWDNIKVIDDFNLAGYRATKWDDMYVHVFLNGEHFDGICLFPKSLNISQREFDNRFFVEKKEIDTLASTPIEFDRFNIATYDEYLEAVEKATTGMFWAVWNDVEVVDKFDFTYQIPFYDQTVTHVFKNGEYFDGICLFSKNKLISKREFDNRFVVTRKEVNVLASTPVEFERFNISTYDQYLTAASQTTTGMFWAIWDDVEVVDDFNFKYQVPFYDQSVTHVFKNGNYYDGICLFSKNKLISKREFDNRFFAIKKEVDITASMPKLTAYDIVFISYNEPNADANYKLIAERFSVKRVHGVKGIHQAHIEAAKLATTDLFYVVDGDAIIQDNFNFDYVVPYFERNHVHVWRSINCINGLEYGYGGVKLLPREKTLAMDITSADMTTSISTQFKALDSVSNITAFNTDSFNTWKSAFRECVKLASRIIERQVDTDTADRLDVWTTYANGAFGEYALKGAVDGKKYGEENKGNLVALAKINDFEWLRKKFDEI